MVFVGPLSRKWFRTTQIRLCSTVLPISGNPKCPYQPQLTHQTLLIILDFSHPLFQPQQLHPTHLVAKVFIFDIKITIIWATLTIFLLTSLFSYDCSARTLNRFKICKSGLKLKQEDKADTLVQMPCSFVKLRWGGWLYQPGLSIPMVIKCTIQLTLVPHRRSVYYWENDGNPISLQERACKETTSYKRNIWGPIVLAKASDNKQLRRRKGSVRWWGG